MTLFRKRKSNRQHEESLCATCSRNNGLAAKTHKDERALTLNRLVVDLKEIRSSLILTQLGSLTKSSTLREERTLSIFFMRLGEYLTEGSVVRCHVSLCRIQIERMATPISILTDVVSKQI